MPAVMVGALLSTLGIEAQSRETLETVPLVSLLVGIWFIVFYIIKAGRIVNYISNPVMGGFISGVGLTIILMQIPKLLGGKAGTGELVDLLRHIYGQIPNMNLLSAILGIGTVVIILVSKKLAPKLPMSVILMILGAVLTVTCKLGEKNVALLPDVESGLPKLAHLNFDLIIEAPQALLVESFLIAAVIMAQTLLASNSYAMKYDYKIDSGKELLAYSAMNIAGCTVGCCPINGSVSRTGIADQYGCKSHTMSIVSGFTILLVLLFGTPFLKYLPVPVLTGIVMGALIGIIDFKQAVRLYRVNKKEFAIFMAALFGVLAFGTIYGVVIGMAISFFAVIKRAVLPPTAFLGQIPGQKDFYNLKRNKSARPIVGTVIYRFGGNLFFGNINFFQNDIESSITPDIKQVIVDARAVGNVDITAADRLLIIYDKLKKQGIKFYITEHSGPVNDQLRKYGAGRLLKEGAVRRTITLALRDAGVERPYPLMGDGPEDVIIPLDNTVPFREASERLAEFEWAFGEDAEAEMENIARQVAEKLIELPQDDNALITLAEEKTSFGKVGLFDEDELLDYLEIQIEKIEKLNESQKEHLAKLIAKRREFVEQKLLLLNPRANKMLHEHRKKLAEHLKETHPEEYARIMAWEASHGIDNL